MSGRQTATVEVWGGVGGVIRHQQRRQRPPQSAGEAAGVNCQQRTKTSRLVRRHFNAHICSSANFRSRNFSLRNLFLEPENFFRDLSRSRLVNIPSAEQSCKEAHVEVTAAVETRAMQMKQKNRDRFRTSWWNFHTGWSGRVGR